MAEKGSATAKLSVIPSFEQKNIKAMGDQLVNGIKASLKDIKLESVFNDANILDGVKKEIEQIDDLFKNRTLKRLDFSGLIPPLAQALEDKSLSEEIRLQIIQGFKEGLESGRTFLQGMPSGMTGNEIKEQFRQSMIMSDAVNSLPGLNKNSRATFKKQWAQITEKDIRQLMSMMDIADEYTDVLPFLLDEENAGRMIRENITSTKTGAPQKAVAAIARLQALATQETKNTGKTARQNALNRILDQKIGNETIRQISDRLQETFPDIKKLSSRVYEGTVARDNAYQNISWDASTIDNLLLKTLQRGYKSGALQKIEPLYRGNYTTPSHITLSDLAEASNRTIDRDESQNNESFVERAENAAERAENASEEARAVAEDMKGTVDEGVAEVSGTSNKSKKKPSTQTSSEPAEQIADDAEADAENAEHVVDVLDDKKAHLESTITELENKNRELQELNNKYQKAISDTFGEVKTPEEALALFKEKAAQLQQADKDFADIAPQRNFTDPSNSEEIAILEEYEKRLAALQQALVEYQKAGETAMGKGVNPTDIRTNQVDEERLQLNFADSTIDGYIKGLQKAIEDNKKKISEYENLLKTYRGQLEEFTKQGSPSDAKPSGGGQTQSRPVVDTAREEAGEVRKSREELQVEREKLVEEIQRSETTAEKAQQEIEKIDKSITSTEHHLNDNKYVRRPSFIEAQDRVREKEEELRQTSEELKDVTKKRQELENQLQEAIKAQKVQKNAQAWMDYIDEFTGQSYEEVDRLKNIPFTEKGKPQRQKATNELKRIGQLYLEHRNGTGYHADQDNGLWKDAYTVLHYRAMEQAKKHQVADSTLSREEFDTDNEFFYQESLQKLKQEREFYRKIYDEEQEILDQNFEQMQQLDHLRYQEKDLQTSQKQQQKELISAQRDASGFEELENDIQNEENELNQLKQRRDEQKAIYDEAVRIQQEKKAQLEKLDQLITEAETRKSAPPTTPATSENRGGNGNVPSSEQTGEESPIVQNIEEQITQTQNTIIAVENKQRELQAKKDELEKILGEYGKEDNNLFLLTDNTEYTSQYWQQAGNATKDPATGAARQLREKGQIFKDTIDAIKEQKQLLNSLDKESNEYQQAEQKLQQLRDKKSRDWLAFYRAHEQLDYWVGKEEGNTRAKQTLNKWTPEKMGLENLGFSQENLDKMIADVKGQAERLAQMRADVAVYQEQYNQLQEQINTLNAKRDNLIAESKRAKPAESKPSQGTNADTPLSSSGAETASGVHQEGTEADNTADKMKALADAKKEALEANQKLAESADVTNNALKGEGDSAIGTEFNALFLALTKIYDLLSQFPVVFSQFNQGLDITPLTEELKALADLISGLPKEGFNLSLGEGTNNFIEKIDDALNKLNDFITAFNTQKNSENVTDEYTKQVESIKQIIEETQKALETNQKLVESANAVNKAIQNESIAGDFNALIIALSEVYELVSKLPNSFADFNKSVKIEPLIKQIKSLSDSLNAFSKTKFNESISKSFDQLNSNINKTLKKIIELSTVSKTEEISKGITEKYEKQITKLRQELNEAKKALKELEVLKQRLKTEENNSTFNSLNGRTYSRNVTKRASKQQVPEIDPLAKEYGLLYQAQQESFKANNIDEYNAALEKTESILQRINELEQKIFSDYGKNPYQDELLSRNYSQLFQDNSQNKNNAQASKNSIKNFVEKQNAEIQNLENSINNIQLIPEEAQTNWDQAYIDKYNSIKESAQEVTTTVQILKETLAQASATGLDQNTLRAFLEFKQTATEQVASTQKEDNNFKSNIVSISNEYISRLSEIEGRLMAIKTDSEKLINIDPSIANTLIFVEQYLGRIKELKDNVSKNPLEIYNSDVRGHIDTTIADLTDKKETENEQNVLEQMEQVSKRSQTNLERIVNNYSRYSTALNKLYKDIAKGSKSSSDELEKDFARINDFSSKIADSTGLAQEAIIKGELKPEASPKIVDAQTEAYNKNAIAFEGMYTKIELKAESAKNKIEEIFGDMDITKSLDEKFIGGNVEGFDEFVQKATQVEKVLKNLKKIQETIKTDDTWLLQQKNADELRQTIATLETSLASVSKASSNFRIVDDLDVQELRASTKQYIRDNPALTGGEVSELNNYIDQLQNKINTVDFKNIEDGIKSVQQTAKEAGHTGDTFMSMLTQRFKSLGAYLLSFVSFYEVIGVFKQGINIIHELDDALTEMNKVSTESLASLKDYQKESFGVANDVGTTATQLQQSTADFVRLGESFQEAKESARVANELLTVSEFDNIQDATTALTAISAAYEDTANGLDKQAIIDKLNKIGDEYAISTDGLATALQDSASALTTANNDMDEAAALLAAGNTVTQDPSKTGKAMRTVALRLVGMKCA